MQLFRFALLRHISMAPHLPFRSHFLQTKSPPDRQAGAKHGWSVRLSFNSAGRCICVRVRLGFDASCSPAHGVSTILRQQPISLQEPYLSNKYTIPWNPSPVNPRLDFSGAGRLPCRLFCPYHKTAFPPWPGAWGRSKLSLSRLCPPGGKCPFLRHFGEIVPKNPSRPAAHPGDNPR